MSSEISRIERCTGRFLSCMYVANPNTKPSAQTTRPQSSRDRPSIPPRNAALARSGRTRAASPPAACCAGAASWKSPRNASSGVKLVMCNYLLGVAGREETRALLLRVLVVLDAEVRDLLLAHHPAQRVLELGVLDEQIVLGVQTRGELGTLKVEGQPFLNARQARAAGEIEEQREVEHERRGENRVAAQEIDFDLHRIAEPSENVDVVPPFLIIAAGWVVVDPHLVIDLAVQLGIEIGLEDVLEQPELGLLLGLERLRIVQHFAVAIAQNVGRIPSRQPE